MGCYGYGGCHCFVIWQLLLVTELCKPERGGGIVFIWFLNFPVMAVGSLRDFVLKVHRMNYRCVFGWTMRCCRFGEGLLCYALAVFGAMC